MGFCVDRARELLPVRLQRGSGRQALDQCSILPMDHWAAPLPKPGDAEWAPEALRARAAVALLCLAPRSSRQPGRMAAVAHEQACCSSAAHQPPIEENQA